MNWIYMKFDINVCSYNNRKWHQMYLQYDINAPQECIITCRLNLQYHFLDKLCFWKSICQNCGINLEGLNKTEICFDSFYRFFRALVWFLILLLQLCTFTNILIKSGIEQLFIYDQYPVQSRELMAWHRDLWIPLCLFINITPTSLFLLMY